MAIKNETVNSTNLGDNEIGNISTWSIPKMISLVKSTFCSNGFTMVERELLAIKKCKKELEDMRGEVSKLWEENMVLRRKGKSAEERCNRLLEEVNSMHEKEHEIIDLRSKKRELENEKLKVESELEILRKRFEKLDKRVSCLETGFNTVQDKDDSKNNNKI
ncbi:hypothetical protein Godav_023680 [Gossypium davidsonii]|uniref:Uncharacterized protein n=2 Tax=Gossypium TaxID=3633 RepID=A0A7J8SSL1_GOSDV|nr:hypothetical protein [Gossypium davidsonii]MBA0664750.1 hypothetical protein [Gossypium klotzschianum]